MIVFTPFTHEEMVAGVHAIAAAAADWRPTLLVGVGRGGLTPAVFLSHRMGLSMVSIDHSTRIAQFGEELVAVLARRTRDGDRLLFVEDINDSGKTIGEIRAALAAEGADMGAVRFAVLIDNIRSAQRVEYTHRQIDRAVTKDWFVFPWEAMAPKAALEEDAMEVPERIG
ncbi:phosphoribosyltransferase [Sphingomonas canadensis]|uniref:Phosphoribosyltransferase n=1 Tax=Sphingomonas canadensis TaxID=1219257 RepID=A0ABW3HFU1_9SPHN|nr:phosphoribosyltransferase domain-containing protein [Sphingomonas canadensis]MCW3837860.1 phosphoribosyltransferase domain-containing protein [Sphingomonas canadensis]